MKIDVQTISPADAITLLAGAPPNRNLVRRRVAALAEAMSNDQWRIDGAPIRLDADGRLLDGQHRLSAVVEAAKPVEFVVVSGLEGDSQLVMDTGKPRTLADYLTIHGVANARSIAAGTSFLWNYLNGALSYRGDFKNRPMPTTTNLYDLHARYADALQEGLSQAMPALRYVPMYKSILAGMWVILTEIDYEDASEFYDCMARRNKDGGLIDAVEVLARRMHNSGRRNFGARLSVREQTAIFIKAWNAYRKGMPVSVLGFRAGGATPEEFPVPQ